jgi:hypothetical protein
MRLFKHEAPQESLKRQMPNKKTNRQCSLMIYFLQVVNHRFTYNVNLINT